MKKTAIDFFGIPFEKRLCRSEFHLKNLGSDFNGLRPTFSQFNGVDIEEYVDLVAKCGLQVWYSRIPIVGSKLTFPVGQNLSIPQISSSKIPAVEIVPSDFVDRFLERAHKNKIIVVQCFNLFKLEGIIDQYPEWKTQNIDDGRELTKNTDWTCQNTPFGEWMGDFLVEQMENHDIDGVWFDDTNFGSRGDRPWGAGCVCSDCHKKYKNDTGKNLPTVVDWNSTEFKHWVNWRYKNYREYQHYITERVTSVRKGAIVAFNNYPRPHINWQGGHSLAPGEGLHNFVEMGTEPQILSKIVLAKKSKRRELWYWFPQNLPNVDGPAELDPVTATHQGLISIANGVPVQGTYDHTPDGKTMKFQYDEFQKRTEYIGGDTFKYCAVLLSQQSRDFGFTDDPDLYWKQYLGVAEILGQSHVIHDVLFDLSLTEDELEPYKVLILPDSRCLSNNQIAIIRRWVQNGGILITNYETSLYDELGNKRPNFGLSEVLGIDYHGTYDKDGDSGTIYAPVSSQMKNLFGVALTMEAQHTIVKIHDNTDIQQVLNLSNRKTFGQQFGGAPYTSKMHDSGLPGVTLHSFGKGQAYYISADYGKGFAHYPTHRLRSFVPSLLPPAPITLNGPSRLELTAFHKNDKLLIHVYQRAKTMMPFENIHQGALDVSKLHMFLHMDEKFPIHGASIELRNINISDKSTASVPLQNNKSLKIQHSSSKSVIKLPPILMHEVIELTI